MPRRRTESPLASLSANMAEAFDELRNEWRIGTVNQYHPRPRGAVATGSNADYHWRNPNTYFLAVERARYWDRNNLVVAQGVDRLCDNVLGEEGPEVTPKTPDTGTLNQDLREDFYGWADDPDECDIEGRNDFWQQSWLAFRDTIVAGDLIGVGLTEGPLQLFENHRLKTPTGTKRNVVQGILLSELGRPLEYWLTRNDVGIFASVKTVGDIKPYPAAADDGTPLVFHPMIPRRISQNRGVTPLAPCADAVPMHDDLQFAKLVQAKVASCFAIIEELSADAPAPPPLGTSDADKLGSRSTQRRDDGSDDILEQLGPGMRIRGRKGVKYTGFSPNIPNAEFFDHAALILSFIAINLNLPLAVLLLDGERAGNFSAWRGAMDQARQSFRRIQKRFAAAWFCRIYRWKIAQLIATKPLLQSAFKKYGKQIFNHVWQSPGWDYIQPVQDAQADLMQVAGCLASMSSIHAKRNRNWTDVRREICEDNAGLIREAAQMAEKLNQELKFTGTPHELTWRDIAALPLPQGMTMRLGPEAQAAATQQPSGSAA